MQKTINTKKKSFFKILLPLLLLCAIIAVLALRKPQAQREDFQILSSLEYDTVFFSMYPTDTYRESDFSYYRGMTVAKTAYCIPNLSVLEQYLEKAAKSGNLITTAYLGLLPDKVTPEKLQELASSYPGVTFEAILPYPSAEYWSKLSESAYQETLDAYCNFLSGAPSVTNANFYFFASQEWLIGNPANYESEWLVTEPIATTLMTHSDRNHGYLVTKENAPSLSDALTDITRKFRSDPETFPDLSDTCVLFFGDSVIANYNDSLSIPGVTAGLTGATVFNCGYGGNSAAWEPDSETEIALPGILDALFQEDLSLLPEDEQVAKGIAAYLSDPPADKRLCFVINYGLNDYFCGYAISSEDPFDTATYSGALRTAVTTIRKNAPDAQIILCTPNFISSFQDGTEPHGAGGYVLSDYADAVLAVAQELKTDVLDNFHELGVNHANQGAYLEDQIHPNAACRYLIGKRISHIIY